MSRPATTSRPRFRHDELVECSGQLPRHLAVSLISIANDVRWLGAGPHCGLCELTSRKTQPGSSIMPGKVNPTQSEALTMVAVQVMGNDAAIAIAGSQGNFELNVFKPVIIFNFLNSVRILADASRSFVEHCVNGIEINQKQIDFYVKNSLMLVTAPPSKSATTKPPKSQKKPTTKNLSLKEATLKLGYLTAEEFDALVKPEDMTHP